MKKFILFIATIVLLSNVNAFSSEEDRSLSKKEISFYTGTFDVIDKEGDDKTNLFGLEHKNPNLFRNTFLGKFKPVTGAFMTGENAVYLYTGIEGNMALGL